jgi:hypothetical protein
MSFEIFSESSSQRPGLYAVGIFTIVLPGTAAKFIFKSSLFFLKFKNASQAKTEIAFAFS